MNMPTMSTLDTTEITLIIAVAVLVIMGVAAFVLQRKRRTARLRAKFGNVEYARTIETDGNRRRGEAGLQERAQRVEGLHVRALGAGDQARFVESWHKIQARFIDGPAGAVAEADQLLADVLSTRGYPVTTFEQSAADISVDHPLVLEDYRKAHAIALRQTQGQATTEDLRQSMVHYRTLFEELVSAPELPLSRVAS